ncbi:MAG: (2Fe-2S)-binding protein [Phycisphaerae bacterium]|nr:(2Fe-2S)-binding protein [Phycisphaerae bacterium]
MTEDPASCEDPTVCFCYRVSRAKVAAFLRKQNPTVASQLSECDSAGTGCGWCRRLLEDMHTTHQAGGDPGKDLKQDANEAARRTWQSERRSKPS